MIPYRVTTFLTSSNEQHYQQTSGYVSEQELQNLALRENSSFLLRLYENHEKKRKSDEKSAKQAGDLTAAAVLASLLDWGFAYSKIPDSVSLVQATYMSLGDYAATVTAVVLMCAGFILKWAWFSPYRPNTVYYPPLYEALYTKDDKYQNTRRYGLFGGNSSNE